MPRRRQATSPDGLGTEAKIGDTVAEATLLQDCSAVTRSGAYWCKRLLHDTDGQVLLLGAIVAIVLIVFLLAIPNATHVVSKKMRAQTAADVGAFTGSVWFARALNLNANMNIGIRSVYTWMTVLTVGSALAQALYSDSLDPSVREMGEGLSLALFGYTNPVYVSQYVYPQSIQRLAQTGRWLQELQEAVGVSFPALAQTAGWEQARQVAGAKPPPAGAVLVRTNDTVPMFAEDTVGDRLLRTHLQAIGATLARIPTNDSNIGPAKGHIVVVPQTFEIKAYYGDSSMWLTLSQCLLIGQTKVNQWYDKYPATPDSGRCLYSARRYYASHKDPRIDSACGKSWIGKGVSLWYIESLNYGPWRVYGKHSYSVPKPGDSVWFHQRHWKLYRSPADTGWHSLPPPDTADDAYTWIVDSGYDFIKSGAFLTEFYTGADSTNGNEGPRLRPRRLNPARTFQSAAYVFWDLGDSIVPRGLYPPLAQAFFPRAGIAARYPTLAVAQAAPYLTLNNPTAEDYFFTPAWDTRLSPLDSVGVLDITGDSAYVSRLTSIDLERLRKNVLLP